MAPRLRSNLTLAAMAAGLGLMASPALAQHHATDADGRVFGDAQYDPRPEWKPAGPPRADLPAMPPPGAAPMMHPAPDMAGWERAKADWLSECRRRQGGDGRTTGTVLGGLVGGVAGSAIAGRGNRTIGAIAGGTIGAVAGSAIGSSADRRRARDYCESYLEDYLGRQQVGYPGHGYPHGGHGQMVYAQGYVLQPVMMMVPVAASMAPAPRKCTETTVVEEWVPVGRPHKRYIPPRKSVIHYKRVPDKRVRTY